jgi:polyhydroxyalkanoate synthesis regulator phasin
MGEDQAGSSKPFDPLESFRGMRDAYLDAMAKAMVEAVNTEGYAQATGAMLDNSLTMSAPFKEAIEKTMVQVLQQLSLPSRQDMVSLAERFTNIEMRLDDMDAKLDRLAVLSQPVGRDAKSEPDKPGKANVKTKPTGDVTVKGAATGKGTPAAKSAPARRRAAKKGTR